MAKKNSVGETVETITQIDAPYELPKGWKWVRLGEVFKVLNGYSFKSDNYVAEGIRIIRITNVQDGFIEDLKPCFYPNDTVDEIHDYLLYENDLLISLTGNVGRIALLPKEYLPAALNQRVACLRPCLDNILKEFFAFYLRQPQFINECIKSSKGTAQLNMSTEWLKRYPIPLPSSISEQQRIVSRIESMFAKLDEAKEKVQNVVDSFETRKAAILHQAFTGNLTAKWRKENGVSDDSWEEKTIGECGICERGRSKHRPRNAPELFGGKYPFIQTGDIANADVYILEHKQTLSEIGLAQSRLFKKGTVCITIAANIGKAAILSYDCCFPDSVVGFSPFDNIDSKFMYFEISNLQKELDSMAPATAQKNLNLKLLTSVKLSVPSLPEQQEIVRILDTVLEKETRAQEDAQTVLDQVALLKKSILARAFRGEL